MDLIGAVLTVAFMLFVGWKLLLVKLRLDLARDVRARERYVLVDTLAKERVAARRG